MIDFSKQYNILHFTTEIGGYSEGGIGTYINELYKYRSEKTGFIHIYDKKLIPKINEHLYPGNKDILPVPIDKLDVLRNLSPRLAVVHYYGLGPIFRKYIIKEIPVIFVVHSVPIMDPYLSIDPFEGDTLTELKFKDICSIAKIIVCVSKAERDRLVGLYPQFGKKSRVIHNGLTLDIRAKPKYIRRKRNRFGYIGRLDQKKGLLDCIVAFKRLEENYLHISCGNQDPIYLSELLNYINAADLSNRICFHGWCFGARRTKLLNSVDALIMPSLHEPFGYVALEMMSEKIPLICSNNGGLKEIIGDYKYNYDPYESDGLMNCLVSFQDDPIEVVRSETERLFSRAVLFTSEIMICKYNNIYKQFNVI